MKLNAFLQNREGLERGITLRTAHNRKGLFHLMNETINPGILSKYFFYAESRQFFSKKAQTFPKLSSLNFF